jgi:hypothetical protein
MMVVSCGIFANNVVMLQVRAGIFSGGGVAMGKYNVNLVDCC